MKNQLFSREQENKEKKCGGEKKQISGEKDTLKHIVFKCEKNARNIFKKKMVRKMVSVKKACECGASQKWCVKESLCK
jgi:hypothetical protein